MTAPHAPFGLSPPELQCLQLLAQGHDIKGIAAELGLSVNAVSERLRSARIKTGATSSRAAARKLAGLEIPVAPPAALNSCDRKSGMAAALVPRNAGTSRPALAGPVGVIAIMLAAAIAALIWTASSPAAAVPQVQSTHPANGSTVLPGPLELRVTFDQPMRADSFSFVQLEPGSYPDCARAPQISADRRTFTLRCTVQAGRSYVVGFNAGRFRNFRAAKSGLSARSTVVRFTVH